MSRSWKVHLNRGELGTGVRMVIVGAIGYALLALLAPRLHMTFEEYVWCVLLIVFGLVLAAAINFVVAAIQVSAVRGGAPRAEPKAPAGPPPPPRRGSDIAVPGSAASAHPSAGTERSPARRR